MTPCRGPQPDFSEWNHFIELMGSSAKESVDALKGPVLQAGGQSAADTDGERAEAVVCPSE